jgi:predicted HTH domain antitoxin
MQTQIAFSIDNSILLSLKVDKEEFLKDALYQYSLYLYRKGKVSLGKAAQLAGFEKIEYILKLQIEKEPIYDYENTEMNEMISTAKDISLKL